MYAIVKRDGKQYKLSAGDVVLFDSMKDKKPKDKIVFEEVLALNDGKELKIGKPTLKAKVEGEVINHDRDKKVIIFKKRRKSRRCVKNGFRRDVTRVRITKVSA